MSIPTTITPGRVYGALVLTTLFWGGSFLFAKIGLATIPPTHFVAFRFFLAALIMLLLSIRRLPRLTRGEALRGAIVGLALGTANITFVFGVKGTSISRASILNNLFVLFIPLLGRIFWKERVGAANFAGVALAVAGIGILAMGSGVGFNQGDTISTFCAFCIALHIISVSRALRSGDDIYLVSLIQFFVVALMATIASLAVPVPSYTMTATAAGTIIYCAIFPTVLCFTLQNTYQRYTTPTRAGLIYTLDPVWSLMAGFLVLGERLSGREWLGCGLIFAAAVLPLLFRLLREKRLPTGRRVPSTS